MELNMKTCAVAAALFFAAIIMFFSLPFASFKASKSSSSSQSDNSSSSCKEHQHSGTGSEAQKPSPHRAGGLLGPIHVKVLASALDDPESALSLDPTLDRAEYADYFSPYANIPDDPGYLSVKASLKGAPDVLPDGRTVRQYLEQKTSEFLGDTGATARSDGVYERIFFVRGGMTGVAVDAICNAANESGLDGGGINGAIHKAVGAKVLEAHVKRTLAPLARNGQRCPPTSARIVCVPADSAARINRQIKFIVYATGPRGEDATRLRQTYWAALTKAHRAGARHFALTCISTSLFGYPPEKAATVAIATVRLWLRVHSHDSSMLVVFNMYDPKSIAAYKKEFGCK